MTYSNRIYLADGRRSKNPLKILLRHSDPQKLIKLFSEIATVSIFYTLQRSLYLPILSLYQPSRK